MKMYLLAFMFPLSAFAQSLSLSEAVAVFEQHRSSLSRIEVGQQLINENFEIHGDTCTLKRKTISTIVDLTPEHALVHNERSVTNCDGTVTLSKFMSKDVLVVFTAMKEQMLRSFVGFEIMQKENIVTFKQIKGSNKKTMEYDLNSNLFVNWVHFHRSFSGVEDHNIKYSSNKKIIPLSETVGLPFCEREPLTLDVLSCK